jgi:hypothetical protein
LANRPVSLPKIVAPFRQLFAIFFMFREMTALTVGGKDPILSLDGIKHPTETESADKAAAHSSRKGDIEGFVFTALRPWDVQCSAPKIDVLRPRVLGRLAGFPTEGAVGEIHVALDLRLWLGRTKASDRPIPLRCPVAARCSNRWR